VSNLGKLGDPLKAASEDFLECSPVEAKPAKSSVSTSRRVNETAGGCSQLLGEGGNLELFRAAGIRRSLLSCLRELRRSPT